MIGTRFETDAVLTRWLGFGKLVVLLAGLLNGTAARAADYFISTQADFDAPEVQAVLLDYQAQLIAHVIAAQDSAHPRMAWFQQLKQLANVDLSAGIDYISSPRHLLEVEHFSYRRRLQKLITKMAG